MSTSPAGSDGACRVLTPPGPAAIAIVQLEGAAVASFAKQFLCGLSLDRLENGAVRRARLCDTTGQPLDDILVSMHADPPDYRLRLHLHGNPRIVRSCCRLAAACDLPEARPGPENVWQPKDRIEAAALDLLPRVVTARGAEWLLDQVKRVRVALDDAIDAPMAARHVLESMLAHRAVADWFCRPARIVLAGPPNTGKSTLANALADQDVSVVSPTPGTTRDWVEVPGELDGFPVIWLDTAGVRESGDPLERAGIARATELINEADAVVAVLDASDEPGALSFVRGWTGGVPACVVLNKCDLVANDHRFDTTDWPTRWTQRVISVSATDGVGMERLGPAILDFLGRSGLSLEAPTAFCEEIAAGVEAALADAVAGRARLAALRAKSSGWAQTV